MEERKRTLVGDATIPLADVFQMISMSQKEGTLIVNDQESRKCIFFGKDGVRLLSSGKRRAPKLGDRLVGAGRLSPQQLQEILAEQKKGGRKFGEIAIARGLITEEELSNLLRTQVEDELCDCFVWKYTHFEFYEGPPSDELLGGDQPITQVTLNVNALLMEALRRRDEWLLIEQQIPDITACYTWTDEGRTQIEALRADAAYAQVVAHIDGTYSVEEIIGATLLSAFDAYRILYDLLQKKFLRENTPAEALQAGQQLLAQGRPDRAVPLLRRTVTQNPADPAAQQTLARAYAATQKATEAADHFRLAGERWLEAGQTDAAAAALREGLQLAPQASALRFVLVKVLLQTQKADEAYAEAQEVLKQIGGRPGSEMLIALCEAVLNVRPTDLDFRFALAAAVAANGDRERARAELRVALRHVTPTTPNRSLRYRRMFEILPDFTEARVALDRLSVSDADRRRRRNVRIAAAGVVTMLLGAAGGWVLYEGKVKDRLQAALDEAHRLRTQGKLEEARDALASARLHMGFTLLHRGLLDADAASVQQDIERRDQQEKARLGAAYDVLEKMVRDAIAVEEQGRLEDAVPLFERVEPESNQRRLPANEFVKRAQIRLAGVRTQLGEALALKAAAAKLEQEGKYADACQKIALLTTRFPRTRAVEGVLLPLYVSSLPAGAAIFLDGKDTRQRTPAVVRLPLQGTPRVSLTRDGFEPFQVEVSDPQMGSLPAPELKKTYAWRHPTGGIVEASPAVAGGLVLAGSSDGHVYALEAASRKPVWEFKEGGAGAEILAPLRAAGDALYVCCNDRHAYALSIPDGPRALWKTSFAAAPRTPPALDPSGAILYLAGADRKLHALDRRSGAVLGSLDLDDVPGAPAAFPGLVAVGTASGTVWAIDSASRRPRWQSKAGGAVTAAPILAGDLLLVGAADGVLYALRVGDGQKAWTYQTGAPITAGAVAAGSLILVGSRDKTLYALDAATGRLRWSFNRAGGPITAAPLAHQGMVYVGSDDGALYAVRLEDGQRQWSLKTEGPVRSTPVALGQRIFFGSNDRHVYAVDVE